MAMRKTLGVIGLAGVSILLAVSCGRASYPDSVDFEGVDAALFRGPDHCDWDGTWMVRIRADDLLGPTTWVNGEERSAPFPGDHMFVRDPDAVTQYSYEVESELARSLPSDARLLGSSPVGYELWFADSDSSFVYVVSSERTEAWVRAVEWGLCA
jgi:hypothetical protein